MPDRTVRFRVTGRVQGVWFRGWTQEQATTLGLTGWVRNEADGSVTGVLHGTDLAVDQMVNALHQGPTQARVTRVEVSDTSAPEATGFEIRR